MFLRQPAIAKIVVDSIFTGVDLEQYRLFAYVVMANHVHTLIEPLCDPSRLMRSIKGVTARKANKLLQRTGEPFWQREC